MNKYGVAGKFIPIAAAPSFRAVDQHSGEVARPSSLLSSYSVIDGLQADVDAMVEKVQAVQAETENVRHLYLTAAEAASVSARELVHALNARDDAERECGELRDQLEAARCRLDELEGPARQRADDL